MMVLVGTREFNIRNGCVNDVECPYCKSQTSMNYSIFIRYTHVTLIPLFPVNKTIYTECNQCNKVFEIAELFEKSKSKLKNETEKYDVRFPVWMFTGVITILGFIIFIIYSHIQTTDISKILIKNPKQGDVYNLKFSNGYYSTMRIDKVTNDSVYATQNDYDVYMPYEFDDIDKTENYTKAKVYYSKMELIELYNKNEIFSITRK